MDNTVEVDVGGNNSKDKSASAVAQAKQEDLSIYEWLTNLSGDSAYRVEIHRKSPKIWKNKPTSGHLATVEEFIDVEDIARQWGGGTYQIKVKRPKPDGSGYVYAGQRTIEVAGEPITIGSDVQTGPAVPVSSEPEGLAKRAMDMTEKAVEQERRRAERIESEYRDRMYENQNRPAVDPGLLEALMGPARDTNRALADQVNRLQDQLAVQMNAPRGEPATNRLLEKFIEGDSSRITQLQAVHDAELRTMKESSREDVKRAEDRLQRLMDATERSHEREVQSLKSSYEQQLKMQEIAFTTQVKNLENMFSMVREELASAKVKITELEAKKDKSMLDSMKEAVEMRELLEAFGGEKEEEPVWKQAIGAISESPLAQAMAAKLTGGVPGGQAGGAMPSGAPPLTPQQQAIVRARAIRAAQQAQHRIQPPSGPAIQLNPAEVQLAVQYLENSLINGTTAEVFVQSARSSIPTGIIQAIRVMGIDQFVSQFVRMDENSHLATVRGRSFLRKVAHLLVGEEEQATHNETPGDEGGEAAVAALAGGIVGTPELP